MKNLILILLVCCGINATAQIEDWYGVDLSRIGYKRSLITFENVPVNASDANSSAFSLTKVKGGSTELSVDLYKKHFYFNLDGSSFLDIGATLFQFDKEKQRWFDNDEYFVLRSDILPIRLAWGTNIGKYVNVYAGGQWSLSAVGLDYKSENSQFRDTRIGGNTYGFGGHMVAAYRFLNVRYSYMYNWQSQARTFKGNSITNELVVSMGMADVGFFAKFSHVYSFTNAGYLPVDRTELFFNEYENADYKWQGAHYASQFQFSAGIYGAGLFSGISKAASKTISDTERGLAKERREDKKRKIIYKE